MRVLIVPRDGEVFFGEDIPDNRVGTPFSRLARYYTRVELALAMEPVEVLHYKYVTVLVDRYGEKRLAVYEEER